MKWLFFLLLLPLALQAGEPKKGVTQSIAHDSLGYVNFKYHCMVCHSKKVEKGGVAPHFSKVLQVYTEKFPDSTQFVERIFQWVMQPVDSLSLLPGAMEKHKIMPKLPYDKKVIKNIAEWIWHSTSCSDALEDAPRSKEALDLGNC